MYGYHHTLSGRMCVIASMSRPFEYALRIGRDENPDRMRLRDFFDLACRGSLEEFACLSGLYRTEVSSTLGWRIQLRMVFVGTANKNDLYVK